MEIAHEGLLAREFADLCGVSKDTLLYYDKIGLFSPELVAENGYRVYSLDQVHTFDLLLLLRDSHLPLKQIKHYLDSRKPEEILALLKKQARLMQEEVAELDRLRRRLESTALRMERGMEPGPKEPQIQQREKNLYVVIPARPELMRSRKQRMQEVREFLRDCRSKGLQGNYLRGAVISKERLLSGCYEKEFFCVCIEGTSAADLKEQGEMFIEQPKGTYGVFQHYGRHQDLPQSYEKLMSYIQEQGLQVCGNAYETELIEYVREQNVSDFVIEIAVEVSGG